MSPSTASWCRRILRSSMADPKKNPLYARFLEENLPRAPRVDDNLPRFDPGFVLGPPVRGAHEKNFLEFYFNNDPRHIVADAHGRPDHYTAEQKAIIEALGARRPLPPGTTDRDINAIVMRLLEKTEHRAQREKVVRAAQKKMDPDDPTITRMLEGTFENQGQILKAIKII